MDWIIIAPRIRHSAYQFAGWLGSPSYRYIKYQHEIIQNVLGFQFLYKRNITDFRANFSLTFWNGLIPGEIYDQKWRVVVCRHSVGDFGSRSTASLSRIQWRDRRRKSAAFRTRDNFQRPAVCFFVETAALPSRYLRPDVRMLAATAHRTSFFPWNSSFPPAQEPWLLIPPWMNLNSSDNV